MLELKQILRDNPSSIYNVLQTLNFHKIRILTKEIICGNSSAGKGNSIHITLDDNLFCKDFKYGDSGDFVSFLMKKRGMEFRDVINIIKSEIGLEYIGLGKTKCNDIFGGAYKKIKKTASNIECKKLDENILIQYSNKGNLRFLKSGISLETQRKFKIGFDVETQRITIPWRDYEGNLIGIMGRTNFDDENIAKYLPVIPFPKRASLYGYCENYKYLQGADEIYIFESEKSVLRLDTLEINTSLSLGRNEVSVEQIKKVIQLNPSKIIFCLDEGLSEDISIKNVMITKKLLKYSNIQLGYVIDRNNDILPVDSKDSPADRSLEEFNELVTNYVKWSD